MKRARFFSALALFVLLLIGCSVDENATVDPIGPDRENFEPVARVLSVKCGSLDCHGSVYRNLRLYGYGGARVRKDRSPDFADIQPEEVAANYEAVVSLEPERMREVVLARGAGPERLSLVRKMRGEENHKGHVVITRGSNAERCILSWLSSKVDSAACTAHDAAPPLK